MAPPDQVINLCIAANGYEVPTWFCNARVCTGVCQAHTQVVCAAAVMQCAARNVTLCILRVARCMLVAAAPTTCVCRDTPAVHTGNNVVVVL